MLRYAVACAAIVLGSGFSRAQPAPCDPNAPATDAQVARRRAAITGARQINTAEAKAWAANKRFAPLQELTGFSIPLVLRRKSQRT